MKPARATLSSRGSALLLVMWVLLLLSAMVLTWVEWIQNGIVLNGEANRAVEARAMAHSGMAVALHPLVMLRTPVPPRRPSPGLSYEVHIVSEGGKLNINWLLRGEEPRKIQLLKLWLEQRGLDFQQRETFVDCLLDYIDADDVQRLNGHEDDGNYHPPNRELQSVEEIAQVWGSGPLTSKPGWSDHLTVYSQGPIDLNSADLEILRLIPGLSESRIQQFLQIRRGPDGIDGTEDDSVFQSLAAIQECLGLTPAQFHDLESLVSYNDPTLFITSIGHSGKTTRKVEVITRKGGPEPQIISWKE